MTESEWRDCTEVEPMLRLLQGRFGDRKRRLFGVACCRQVWRLVDHEACRRAVEVAEAFAEGEADDARLGEAALGAREVVEALTFESGVRMSLKLAARRDAARAAALVAESLRDPRLVAASARDAIAASPHPAPDQCSLLRCIYGPAPFRPIAVEPDWVSWNGGAVATMAESINRERAFDRLPILGDALEEAGCTDADILGHCRHRGEHVRGCWAIDLLLGKE